MLSISKRERLLKVERGKQKLVLKKLQVMLLPFQKVTCGRLKIQVVAQTPIHWLGMLQQKDTETLKNNITKLYGLPKKLKVLNLTMSLLPGQAMEKKTLQ
jgi:hypothetical protein